MKNRFYFFLIIPIVIASFFYVMKGIQVSNGNKLLTMLKNLDVHMIDTIEIFKDYRYKKSIADNILLLEFTNTLAKTEAWQPQQPILNFFYYILIVLKNGERYKLELNLKDKSNDNIVYIYYIKSWSSNARYKNPELYDWILKAEK